MKRSFLYHLGGVFLIKLMLQRTNDFKLFNLSAIVCTTQNSFKGNSQLWTWIHKIIARAALKKIKNRINFEDLNNDEEAEPFDWGSVIDVPYLEKAISSLPDGYRSVFILYEVEGFMHKEIAEMMNISVNTSKTQL